MRIIGWISDVCSSDLYAIGFFLFDTVEKAILNAYGLLHQFDEFAGRFNEQGWIIVMLAGFTPLPFKVITIAAGSTTLPLYILLVSIIISRPARFFIYPSLLLSFLVPMTRVIFIFLFVISLFLPPFTHSLLLSLLFFFFFFFFSFFSFF